MANFLQTRIELISEWQSPEDIQRALYETLEATLREIVGEEAFDASDLQLHIERPTPLAIETPVVLALIGLSVKLVDLIMFLIKRRDEAKKLDMERAKAAAEKVGQKEKEEWRREFVEQILLAKVLAQTPVQPIKVVVQVVQVEVGDGEADKV